ncbi:MULTISPECIES: HPr(Ser) kinase/phosphatase [Fructobacillus]|jgi:HPr kinase/phosphorylase|uniref:HPr kinase/phosphorylase n=3 Tax=Fructobacillus TaxID=559173 RepID=A0A3F3H8E9_9LACO|nr:MULTISPECIES: HPr(Ser) kinase/phosphatase [Fructobacillus]CAK1221446.1 Serine kinase of the HPr protein [Fructobacillus sp. LMG 32999]CAK1234216.1 Serine kinase of the HPr protein [Fructobacillus cardui]KMK53528.1 HPr kinase/phosphorylase [Fructobacillus sp. EFB-N1]NLS38114.1 HPr kinase/phosphorylase [Fructobacillus tropaeoli]CAK1221603.1 Serine kinase of the HPr protein [Fructobacillus sp. LMG 32999]
MAQATVTVKDLVDNTRLTIVAGHDYLNRVITTADISRPGLEMTGYFTYYAPERVQLLGITETSFSDRMSHDELLMVYRKMASKQTPAFVVSTNLPIADELKQAAEEAQIPILNTRLTSSQILSNMTYYLGGELAPRQSVHGVLIDVHGLGVLITGDAGIGKTESALELIQQGKARLVADDRVDIHQEDEQRLIGQPSEVLRNLMEVRGVGIIDVQQVYGAVSVRSHASIMLNIHLSNGKIGEENFDRLGNEDDTLDILGVKIKKMVVPVTPGRNTASVIDAAAVKFRTQNMGYDALETLEKRMSAAMQVNEKEDEEAKKHD